MKKVMAIMLAVCVILGSASIVGAEGNIALRVDGSAVKCDVAPAIINNRTMVPFRAILESLGADVNWNDASKTVCAKLNGKNVSMQINNSKMTTDAGDVNLDSCPVISNGRTLVPVRALSEGLNCKVNWNDNTRTVDVITNLQNMLNNNNTGNVDIVSKLKDMLNNNNSGSVNVPTKPANGNTGTVNVPTNPTNGNTGTGSVPTKPVDNGNTPTVPDNSQQSSIGLQVLSLVNQYRAQNGLPALTYDSSLEKVAYAHSKDMSDNNYFSHDNLSGKSPFDRMAAAGISYSAAAENIAMGQRTAEEVMNGWMNSEGHRANILNSRVTKMGLGFYNNYWTQDFIG